MPRAITVRNGSVRVKIFQSKSGEYVRHEIRWTDHHHRRHRLKRSSLTEAKREAKRIADDLARGHHHAELSLADLASFRAAIVNLYGCGKTLELATAEYAECQRVLRATLNIGRAVAAAPPINLPSLSDLASFWLENRETSPIDIPVPAAVVRLLEAKTQQGISPRWHSALSSALNCFAKAHPANLSTIDAATVRAWAYSLPVGARSKNNHLAAVKLLFNQPELRTHRARQGILDLPAISVPESTNALWQPEEFRRLLHAASATVLPVLVLGGFAKMRSSEIMRLEATNIRLHESRIVLRAGQTKTRRWRIVPLPACAVAWLHVCDLPAAGKLWPWGSHKFNAALRSLAGECNLKWRKNALRNSATTYDQICTPDVARVAREAGNSPNVLETEYFALHGVTKETAEAWFNLWPPPDRKRVIVPMLHKEA